MKDTPLLRGSAFACYHDRAFDFRALTLDQYQAGYVRKDEAGAGESAMGCLSSLGLRAMAF
jgi:hypothetical protein